MCLACDIKNKSKRKCLGPKTGATYFNANRLKPTNENSIKKTVFLGLQIRQSFYKH